MEREGKEKVESWIHEVAPASGLSNLLLNLPSWPSEEAQAELVQILTDTDYQRLPPGLTNVSPPHKYLQSVLQLAKRDIEKHEICPQYNDDFMDLFLNTVCEVGDAEDTGFALYKTLLTDRLIPIKIKRSHNEVGTKVWTAGIFLTELIQRMAEKERSCWCDASVLELGAGVGITGLVLARGLPDEIQPNEVLLSDYPLDVMELLAENTTIVSRWNDRCKVDAKALDWAQVNDHGFDDISLGSYNCILAADCTYSEDLNSSLVRLFEAYFELYSQHHSIAYNNINMEEDYLPIALLKSKEPFVLIACTERNIVTYQHFLSVLEQSKICQGIDITFSSQQLVQYPFYVDYSVDRNLIRILCIRSRYESCNA
jgi:hypothetical protein